MMSLIGIVFGLVDMVRFIIWVFAMLVKGLVALSRALSSSGSNPKPRRLRRSTAGTRRCLFCGTRSFTFEIQVAGGCPAADQARMKCPPRLKAQSATGSMPRAKAPQASPTRVDVVEACDHGGRWSKISPSPAQ